MFVMADGPSGVSVENIQAKLYDSKNIDELEWPETTEGQYAKKFLTPLVKNGISHYVKNIHADIYVLKVKELVFPITVVTENYSNSWVCSPYSHYISYGKEFANIVGSPFLTKIAKSMLDFLGKLGKFGKINSVAYVNNWMFSVDLYPEEIKGEQIDAIIKTLTLFFPEHAIIFRSLNNLTTPNLIKLLEEKNFDLICSRYVYVTDTKKESIFKTRILKSDLRLWENNPFKIYNETDLKEEEYEQLLDLYLKLYVSKHSSLQPQFNIDYFKLFFEKKLMQFKVLKYNGDIKGVAGYCKRGNGMICPIFGFQKNAPDSNKVYRLLNLALLMEAQKEKLLFNQSAGAAAFKSIRRAEGCLEYIAVYTHHLPTKQKLFWPLLKMFFNKVASKYMKNY